MKRITGIVILSVVIGTAPSHFAAAQGPMIVIKNRFMGRIGPEDRLIEHHVSPNGRHLALAINRGVAPGTVDVVFDGQSETYENFAKGSFAFSPDGKRNAYIIIENNKLVPVIDGRKGKGYNELSKFVFSPNSIRVAYPVLAGDK